MAWIQIRVDTYTTVNLDFYYIGEGAENKTIYGDSKAGSGDGYVDYWGPAYIRVVSWEGGSDLHVAGYTDGGSTRINTDVSAGYIINNPYRLRFYAITPTPTSYTVSYSSNGIDARNMPDAQTKTPGTTLVLSYKKPAADGYTFLGWGTNPSSYDVSYQPGDPYYTDANITLFAIWIETTYTLSFDSNGGSGSMSPLTGDTAYVLPDCSFSRDGYRFIEWNTESDGSGDSFAVGAGIILESNTTVFAIWTRRTYTVKYNGNGNGDTVTNVPVDQTKTYGIDLTLSRAIPRREGYEFKGWAYSSSATTPYYAAGDTYTTNAGAVLYAVWVRVYTVAYNTNGGDGGPSSGQKTHDVAYTIPSATPTKTGYIFAYWVDNLESGKHWNPGDSYTTNSNVTFSAIWTARTYSVQFRDNGGSGAPSDQTKIYGVDLTLSSTVPTRTGHTFQGWGLSSSATTATYQPGDTYKTNAGIVLWAVWKANEYNVKYNANGGSGAPADQKKVYGVDLTLSTVKPTKTDSVFVGWGLSSSATTVTYYPGDTYKTNAGIVLYAVWTTKTKFYWHGSNTEDAKYFKVGARIDLAVTASAWNDLCDYINVVRTLVGLSEVASSKVKVQAGEAFSAAKFNNVRNAIYDIVLKGYGSHVPSTVSKGQEITTALFNGADGLKAAINSCMDDL